MKTLNLIACILFGIATILCLVVAITQWRLDYLMGAIIVLAVSFMAYKDYKSPE
jgi:hypothetical protein